MKHKPPNLEYWFSEAKFRKIPEGDPLDECQEQLTNEGRVWQQFWCAQHSVARNYKLVTLEEIKQTLSVNQWSKFCQGERHFIKEQTKQMRKERVRRRFLPKKKCT